MKSHFSWIYKTAISWNPTLVCWQNPVNTGFIAQLYFLCLSYTVLYIIFLIGLVYSARNVSLRRISLKQNYVWMPGKILSFWSASRHERNLSNVAWHVCLIAHEIVGGCTWSGADSWSVICGSSAGNGLLLQASVNCWRQLAQVFQKRHMHVLSM